MKLPAILRRVVATVVKVAQNLQPISSSSWLYWWSPIRESFSGAWQQNVTLDPQPTIVANSAVFSCITGISSDVAKLRIKLTRESETGVYVEIRKGAPWLPVLRKPNHYQNRIKFIEHWIISKLICGNTYVLKGRQDARGIVTHLYILDPLRVTPLVAENGDVYYQLAQDFLTGINEAVTVPASEIIHDRMYCLFHPLVGVSPIFACAMSATMGNKIQQNSTNLFANQSRPGGILTAPGHIADDTALRLKAAFEANFTGTNVGKLAVLGDGLKFEPMIMTAEANQLIDQLKWTVEDVGRCFHYPPWKMGGPLPPYSTGPQALTMMYYTDCLQTLIENLEICLDEGLELPTDTETELDVDNLLRMDTASLFESNNKAVGGGWMKPDEARYRANLEATPGGDSCYLQQQNFSLEALAKRDAKDDPFASAAPKPQSDPNNSNPNNPPPAAAVAPPQKDFLDEELTASELLLFQEELMLT